MANLMQRFGDFFQVKIYEEENEQQEQTVSYDHLMTDEQKQRGQYYIGEYQMRLGEIARYIPEWEEIMDMYRCYRAPDAEDPDYPNNFIAMITPTVEGQVASIIESTVEFTHTTNNPAGRDAMFALDAASEYVRAKNSMMRHMKDFTRFYDLLGNAWLGVSWEDSIYVAKGSPAGYPRLENIPLEDVFVDGRIKDYKDLQHAEYIIRRVRSVPIRFARDEYGDEYAEAIAAGMSYNSRDEQVSIDDVNSFVLLLVWTRNNEQKNLQLIEMDENGLILRESDPSTPYFEKVYNEYPFRFARMMPNPGEFYGFGDGKILMSMQRFVNNMTNELERAARFNAHPKTVVDPRARAKLSQFNSSSKPIVAENPNQNIRILQAQGVSPTVQNTIDYIMRESQRSTRFHDIMTGNVQGSSATATQINSQMMQGHVGINDKKSDISDVMAWADMYCLRLCIEHWDTPFWAKVGNTEQWVDLAEISQIPSAVPKPNASAEIELFDYGRNPAEISNYETVMVDEGVVFEELDFDVKVVLGQGIPKGRIDVFNMVMSLLQIQIPDAEGRPQMMISMARAKELMEEVLGFRLETTEEEAQQSAFSGASGLEPFVGMGEQNPATEGEVQMPQGSQMRPATSNVAQTVPGGGMTDMRRLQ